MGAWCDIVWSLTLVMPLAFAATWDSPRGSKSVATAPVQAKNAVVTRLFPLLYPLFVLVMSARIAHERIAPAFVPQGGKTFSDAGARRSWQGSQTPRPLARVLRISNLARAVVDERISPVTRPHSITSATVNSSPISDFTG
jgi:hypothetical protein